MSAEGNRHVAEERNQVSLRDNDKDEGNQDEEELYSNVIRENSKEQGKSWRQNT